MIEGTTVNLCVLPTKRESILMLYENKAVSENTLKSTLENHFYNINVSKGLRMKSDQPESQEIKL